MSVIMEKCQNCPASIELFAERVGENATIYRNRCMVHKKFLDEDYLTKVKKVIPKLLEDLDKEIEINQARENESSTKWDRGFYNGCATEAIQLRVKIREIMKKVGG